MIKERRILIKKLKFIINYDIKIGWLVSVDDLRFGRGED